MTGGKRWQSTPLSQSGLGESQVTEINGGRVLGGVQGAAQAPAGAGRWLTDGRKGAPGHSVRGWACEKLAILWVSLDFSVWSCQEK